MTKNLHKVNMKRSKLRNKFLNDRTEMSPKEYKKQRNFSVHILKRAKKEHLQILMQIPYQIKRFWQIVKPLFLNKVKVKTSIKLVENKEAIDNETEIAKLFNEYFVNIV